MLLCMPGVPQSIPHGNESNRITLSYNSVPLIKVIRELCHRYGFAYIIRADDMLNTPVSIQVRDATLLQVIEILSASLPVKIYNIRNTLIIQRIQLKGVVTDINQNRVAGASVINRRTMEGVNTDSSGFFVLQETAFHDTLLVTHVSYKPVRCLVYDQPIIKICLAKDINQLPPVDVYTGYQNIPVEQATGSFKQANMQQVTGISHFNLQEGFANNLIGYLPALKTTTGPGLIVGSLRGRSTIISNTQALVLVDDFPFYSDLYMLNPNDIESITVAKDASSTSIYGTRAANGIILITTKKANWKQPTRISFNNFITVSGKPDINYVPTIQPKDFVSLEEKLFNDSYFAAIGNQNVAVSPVIQILTDYKHGRITTEEKEAALYAYKNHNLRSDIQNLFYRPVLTQYSGIQFSGCHDSLAFLGSMSSGHSSFNEKGISHDRTTILTNIRYHHKKLSITTGIFYSGNNILNNFVSPPTGPPYLRLADTNGTPLPVPYLYSSQFVDTAGSNYLLDWHMRPLQELANTYNVSRYRYMMANARIGYQFTPSLQIQALYQFGLLGLHQSIVYNLETFFARNLINNFTQLTPSGIARPIPPAPILDKHETITHINNWRLQSNFHHQWGLLELSIIGGIESQKTKSRIDSRRIYGYGLPFKETDLNYQAFYAQYSDPGLRIQIPTVWGHSDSTDYYLSCFGNAFYTWSKKITVSLSFRQDQSNRFGMYVNRKFIPLISEGILIHLHKFPFFPVTFPLVSLRGTIGKTGNDGLKTSWSATISQVNDPTTNLPLAYILNPGNPYLQFEELASFNMGLDVKTRDRRIQLSLDVYWKEASKLLSYSKANPTSGVNQIKSNSGRLSGFGIDANVRTVNIKQPFTWETDGWISYTTNKVQSRELLLSEAWRYVDPSTYFPRQGYPVEALFAFRSGGLDEKGDPFGYLEGKPSESYWNIISADPRTLRYIGSATPTLFGCITNTLQYKGLLFSFQITGKFHYYFRRTSLNGLHLNQAHGDYYKRWQNPGDENHTTVPALKFNADPSRELFYQYSETLVQPGDHLRLQNLQLLHNWEGKKLFGQKFSRLQMGLMVNNLGILWRANGYRLDPDVVAGMLPAPTSFTISMAAQL